MRPQEFLEQIDDAKVIAAIAEVESKTSGEIRVYVSKKNREDALAAARIRFEKMRMTKTRERNAVLIYFAPVTRHFAVVGDAGVHAKCGDAFWEATAATMSALLREGKVTEAIVAAVRKVGEPLATHFPRQPDDQNELPDEIIRG